MARPTVLFQTAKLKLEMELEGDVATVRPIGAIDEDVNFSVLLQTITQMAASLRLLQFDMGQLTSMNSCGVREWLMFMERVTHTCKYVFVDANELFVEQANMVANMFGRKGTTVLSFQAPYHCPSCLAQVAVRLKPSQVTYTDNLPEAPVAKCPKCQVPLEFDSIEEEYFCFIKRTA